MVVQDALILEVGTETTLTTNHLFVEGVLDTSSVVYTASKQPGVTFLLQGEEVTSFTQADVEAGWVSIKVDGEACEEDLSKIEMQADGGSSAYSFAMKVETGYASCTGNEASHPALSSGVATLLITSGLGLFANRVRQKPPSVTIEPVSEDTQTESETSSSFCNN